MSDDADGSDNQGLSVVSTAGEADTWSSLKESRDPKAFSEAWLDIQARQIGDDALSGIVVLGIPDQGPFEPIGVWPRGSLGSPII